ncbi:hypothetical protein AVEN_136775-1 [Araneus ventricosus]|uniref:Uncharacterized protein n=1 Tax=Araneus ventricosus TaxID=182803 RepID=A0A4Y1ZPR9_ARAVE|nr:hypothetical protein AVEN_136775-1 [Araneus ventricosus]
MHLKENDYYIPHRAVLRKELLCSTKLRVVYDASSKDKNQKSLNDCLLKVQTLFLNFVLLKFRLHRIAPYCRHPKASSNISFVKIRCYAISVDSRRFEFIESKSSDLQNVPCDVRS